MEQFSTTRQMGNHPSRTDTEPALAGLTNRLREMQQTRLALMFLDRFDRFHLKDITTDRLTGPRVAVMDGHEVINFGSDSFLGLDRHPALHRSIREALATWGTHNGASRAFTSVALYEEAESRLARWLGVEATLIYPSVTMANAALLSAVAESGDLLVVDRESHDSIHEGARLAEARGARVEKLHHCHAAELRRLLQRTKMEGGLVVAIDGTYSMTGDVPPLAELLEVVEEFGGTLYVDDAHGTGVIGPGGRGAAFAALGRLDEILMVGSLSKAFSCLGGFVTCTRELQRILKIRSHNFIFSGPVPAPYLAAICAVCDIIESPEHEMLRRRLQELTERLVAGVKRLGFAVQGGIGPIVSVVIGDIERTLRAGRALFDAGFYVQSATFPAVPITSGLLRILVNAIHTEEQIDGLLAALAALRDTMESDGYIFPSP